MFSKNFRVSDFKKIKINRKLKKYYKSFLADSLNKKNLLNSFTNKYSYSFSNSQIKKLKKFKIIKIFGMGGSSLGAEAIYKFMKKKIKKEFQFFSNLDNENIYKKSDKKELNIIISKSGNTLETVVNENLFSGKSKFYIVENKTNYLRKISAKLKSDIIEHRDFVGGRYSVLSEVGMLPAELMGLKISKFKSFNRLILNKKFENNLLRNVSNIYNFILKGKTNSIILNYDECSYNLFKWYQQLVAESLGKNSKGVLPIISEMPRDNHSLMQLYLDGTKNCFYTFFDVNEKKSPKIKRNLIIDEFKFLKNHNLQSIKSAQKNATKRVFTSNKIPFRSFEITNRNEECLGELFTYFMLETILLGKLMKINPFNQPSVELIKKETKKILV
tara:strand:+ start:576 stop:1736 length:1161 start_codon:yes stop_codon:yes gene_type:complete